MPKLTKLTEYAPFIEASNKETDCRNRMVTLEQKIQELRNSHQKYAPVLNPDDLDAVIESADRPDLNGEITKLSNQVDALRKVLPTLEQRTREAKREFNYALAKQHQAEFSAIESQIANAYIVLQSAAKEMADFERGMQLLAQDDVAFSRETDTFHQFIPDPNNTVHRDFYRNIDIDRLPENIRKIFGHIAKKSEKVAA